MNKKGGMELSINAIVILIIAMVVLGIGILFIRGLFSKSAEKLTTAISSQEIANPATPDQPIAADREVLISRTNPTKTIKLSVFNVGNDIAKGIIVNMSNCVSSGASLSIADYSLRTSEQNIPKNSYVGYQAIVKFNPSANISQGDTIVCKIFADTTDSGTAQFWTDPSTTITFTIGS